MPFYPSKVLRIRERALIPYSSIVLCLGLTFESLKELGARHKGDMSREPPFNPLVVSFG
jgi:hypothetical protein